MSVLGSQVFEQASMKSCDGTLEWLQCPWKGIKVHVQNWYWPLLRWNDCRKWCNLLEGTCISLWGKWECSEKTTFQHLAPRIIGAKPNLYCEAIELVCGGSPTDLEKTNSMNSVEFNCFKDFPPILLIFPQNFDPWTCKFCQKEEKECI